MSVGEGGVALVEDIVEHAEDAVDVGLVGEVLGEGEHNFDHFGPLGAVGEVFQQLLDVILSLSNLNEGSTILQLTHELNALIQGSNGISQFLNGLLVGTVVGSSLSDGVGHIGVGLVNQRIVVGDLSRQLVDERNEDVVDVVGGLGDIRLGGGDSGGDGGGQDVVVVGLQGPLLHLHISLKLEIVEESSESGLKLIQWSTKFELKCNKFRCDLTPAGFLELLNLVLDLERHFGGVGGRKDQSDDDDSSFHFDFFGFFI